AHQLQEDQVEQTQRHGWRSCPASQTRPISLASGTGRLLEPHRFHVYIADPKFDKLTMPVGEP
ncbi:MAG: hypothetical protein M3460_27995, partial [Actinomycetota bacterium]|nr:hypothetical protein [Actinomycetota bacterium]